MDREAQRNIIQAYSKHIDFDSGERPPKKCSGNLVAPFNNIWPTRPVMAMPALKNVMLFGSCDVRDYLSNALGQIKVWQRTQTLYYLFLHHTW